MPIFKTFGAAGAWINGRWHPNGAQAALSGANPPMERTRPAHPDWVDEFNLNKPKPEIVKPVEEEETNG